jgi:hypothetical protein
MMLDEKIATIDRIIALLLRGDILNDHDNFALISLLEELKNIYAAAREKVAAG